MFVDSEFDYENERTSAHAVDERLFKEDREPQARAKPTLHVLQLRAEASDVDQASWRHPQDACDGRRGCGPCVDDA